MHESITGRIEHLTDLSEESVGRVVDIISPELAEVYLTHCSPEVFRQIDRIFLPMVDNLENFADVFESPEFIRLRGQERKRKEKRLYTTGVVGCIDGRVYQIVFGFPLNTSVNREPAGLFGFDDRLDLFKDHALREAIKGRLERNQNLSLIEFFTSHTSLTDQVLDEHGHTTVCGATRADLDLVDEFDEHPDGGLKWDMDRKIPIISDFEKDFNEHKFKEERVKGVQAIFDTDSLGLVFGAERLSDPFLTQDVILASHERGDVLFTAKYMEESEVQSVLQDSGFEQGQFGEMFGKPEHLMELLEALVETRDRLSNALLKLLRSRLKVLYGIEGKVSKKSMHRKMLEAVADKIFWNVAVQYLSGWGTKVIDHPLRHHNEDYILCGPKGETNGLYPVPFWAKTPDGINIALSLFPENAPVLISFTGITEKAKGDAAGRVVGGVADTMHSYINEGILDPLEEMYARVGTGEMTLDDFENVLNLFLSDGLSPKLRTVFLPILLLQQDSRRILIDEKRQKEGKPSHKPGINTDFVRKVMPKLHKILLGYREELDRLKEL